MPEKQKKEKKNMNIVFLRAVSFTDPVVGGIAVVVFASMNDVVGVNISHLSPL